MTPGEEMSGTGRAGGLMEEQSIGAESLKTVMLHDHLFAQKEAEYKRAKRGTSHVDEVRSPEQARQFQEARIAHHSEG